MLKRFVILGLVLLLVGSAALGWVLAEKKKEQQQTAHYQSKYGSELGKEMEQYDEWLRLPAEKRTALPPVLDEHGKITTKAQLLQQQQGRLKADMDKLAGGEADAQALADFLYGEGWQQELNKYKGQKEQRELILNGSIVCMSIGGAILSCCLFLCIVRLAIRVSSRLGKLLAGARTPSTAEIPDQIGAEQESRIPDSAASASSAVKQTSGLGPSKAGPQEFETQNSQIDAELLQVQPSVTEQHKAKKLLRALSEVSKQNSPARPLLGVSARPGLSQGQPAPRVKQTTTESPDPLNNTLVELTQQVAAIREYASNQQDRVQKLQEGYDWNIIRNFCLRVIRCIDNVENRIRERAGRNGEAVHLREIRDELLFALESSGIEQFEPQINSDYLGQEKHTETIKERESCDDPDLIGKIAKVIRPGYQYFVDDKNVKVVRPAMVMLFG